MSAALYKVTPRSVFNRIFGDNMATDNNMKSATETYSGFLSWLKIGTIISVLVTVLVVILIST
ncbi:MAG: hypothetical protein ABJL35_16140 [Parasphingorhabdus sp.]|uniref:hypothetical protein n=1 Tax=Parasphingorhabdus sp. TaxID=2709688 RepID=UPI0032974F70